MNNKYVFGMNSGDFKVEHTIDNEVRCIEIVRHFTYFLRGCSFGDSVISDSLKEISDELGLEE